MITSNSGSTGTQILFQEGGTLGDYATISATNSGTYSGTNTHGGSNVGGMNLQQISFGVYTLSPEPYTFSAGDYFNLSASSSGTDSSNGTGGNAVGDVSEDQITFFLPATLGTHANISITNCGNFSGNASSSLVTVGSAGGSQLGCQSSFSAGDNFTLCACNSGTNTGTGIGDFFIGDIGDQQVSFQDGLRLGNNASITISNSGSNSSDTTSGNEVGSFTHYGKQFLVKNQFQIGNDFVLKITNCGFDDSTGAGGNLVGFMNNDTIDDSASQFHLADGGTVGDRASVTLSNTGTYQGSNTMFGNLVGVLAGQQLYSVSDFHAGNDFELTVCNSGIDNASGQNSHSMGTLGRSQVEFGGACVLGTNATITLSNSGTNNDTTGTSNNIGVIGGAQMFVDGNFSAGPGLNISADNAIISAGNTNNTVGYVNDSQLVFSQGCTLNDGTFIGAVNSGGIRNSQIVFGQGFDIVSGKVTIQAVNTGMVGAFGIDIEGSSSTGGDANIILSNSSLNIGTTLSTFTIGALNGDSTSVVQSQPQLIINTDALTQSVFLGVIQDFPATSSTLMKTGAGTQTLSGINTYTGLTTVDEGILVLNGSLAGDVLINPLGTLKGNGTIVGTLTNTGVVSPGQSIGRLIAGNYINNNGTYDFEANGFGQSDLILVTGTATLNGGTVIVSSADGTFRIQQPYTILTADGGVSGTFTNATSLAFVKPILTYDPNNVYVTLQSTLVNAAEKCNQLGVATNLDSIVGPNAAQSLLIGTLANLPLEDAQEALESLSGFQYTNDVLVSEISTSRLLRRLYDPLRSIVAGCDCCSPCDECTAWLETGYGFTSLQGSSPHKLHFDSYQVTGGFQKTICCDFTFGLAGSYEYDHVTYRDGKTNRNAEFASVYGLYRPCMFYGLVDFVYGYSSNHLKRTIEVGNLRYKAHSKPNYNNLTFYGEAGFDLECECALIQPFLGIQIGRNWRNKINENQSDGWGLILCKHDWMSTRSRLGLHITTCNLCNCIDTSVDIAWNQLWSSSKISNVGRFNQFGNAFPICGNKLDNYSFDYAVTFTTCLCEGLKGYLELDGEWWQHANTFNVIGGIEYAF